MFHAKRLGFSLATAALLSSAAQANLVTNGGFEADLSDWTKVEDTIDSNMFVDINAAHAHSGTRAAVFGAGDVGDDSISQTLTTVAGQSYSVSFWLWNNTTSSGAPTPDAHFAFSWGSSVILDVTDATDAAFQQYLYTLVATSASTTVQFSGRSLIGFARLDDVEVTAIQSTGPTVPTVPSVPEPASIALTGLALAAVVCSRRSGRR